MAILLAIGGVAYGMPPSLSDCVHKQDVVVGEAMLRDAGYSPIQTVAEVQAYMLRHNLSLTPKAIIYTYDVAIALRKPDMLNKTPAEIGNEFLSQCIANIHYSEPVSPKSN